MKWWETKGLDVPGGQTDCEDWLGWVDGLGEDVGAEGQAADVFEHCCCDATDETVEEEVMFEIGVTRARLYRVVSKTR